MLPLKSGSSNKTISSNIKELVNSNKRNKQIGNTHKRMTHDQKVKQAVAISLSKAGKSNRK